MSDVFGRRFLKQRCVYWPPAGVADDGRTVKYGPPEEIACRWSDVQEQYLTRAGEVQVSNSLVMVEKDVEPDGALFLGTLSGAPAAPAGGGLPPGAWEIKGRRKVPDAGGRRFVRTAIL